MPEQVTITVHRRNADGTWPPGEDPPTLQYLLVTLRSTDTPEPYQRLVCLADMPGGVVVAGCEHPDAFYNPNDILAWADVTEVLK